MTLPVIEITFFHLYPYLYSTTGINLLKDLILKIFLLKENVI